MVELVEEMGEGPDIERESRRKKEVQYLSCPRARYGDRSCAAASPLRALYGCRTAASRAKEEAESRDSYQRSDSAPRTQEGRDPDVPEEGEEYCMMQETGPLQASPSPPQMQLPRFLCCRRWVQLDG